MKGYLQLVNVKTGQLSGLTKIVGAIHELPLQIPDTQTSGTGKPE